MRLEEIRSQIESLDIIRSIPAEMRMRVVVLFLGIATEEQRSSGDTLFQLGAANDGTAYILLDGALTVSKPDAPEVEVGAPHLLGELAQMDKKQQRGATVRVDGTATLLRFTWSDFASAAKSVLNAAEAKAVHESLERLAWEHLTG